MPEVIIEKVKRSPLSEPEMRQSIVSHMQKKLKEAGYSNARVLPSSFDEDYEPLWFQFLESRIVKDLKSKALNAVQEKYMIMAAFFSYVESYDSTGYKFNEDGVVLLKPIFLNTVNSINGVIRSLRLLTGLKPVKLVHDIEYSRNELINAALELHVEGFIWFQPKSNQVHLNDFLYGLKGSLYKTTFPEKLKYAKLTSDQLLNSEIHWHQFLNSKSLKIDLGRTRGSMLVLKYQCDISDYPIFYGNQFKSVDDTLTKLWSNILTIG